MSLSTQNGVALFGGISWIAKQVGEFLREASVLVIVFVPLEGIRNKRAPQAIDIGTLWHLVFTRDLLLTVVGLFAAGLIFELVEHVAGEDKDRLKEAHR